MKEKQCLNEQWKLKRNAVPAYYTILLIVLLICPNNGSGYCDQANIFTSGMYGQFFFPNSDTLHLWYKTETISTNIRVYVEIGCKCTCGVLCLGGDSDDGVHRVANYTASNTDHYEKLTITYSGSFATTYVNGSQHKRLKIDRKPIYVSVGSNASVWFVKCRGGEPLNIMDTKEVSALKEGYHRLEEGYRRLEEGNRRLEEKYYRKEEEAHQRLLAVTIGLGVFGLLAVGISVAACLCLRRQYKTPNINTTNMSQANGCENMDAEDADYITPITPRTFTTETRNQDSVNEGTDENIYESVFQENESSFSTRECTHECSAPNHLISRQNSLYESWTPK